MLEFLELLVNMFELLFYLFELVRALVEWLSTKLTKRRRAKRA